MLTDDEIRVNGFQPYQTGPEYTKKTHGGLHTSEMQLWSIKEENGQELDQVCPPWLDAIYRLVVGEAGPPLAVKIEITGRRYGVLSSVSRS